MTGICRDDARMTEQKKSPKLAQAELGLRRTDGVGRGGPSGRDAGGGAYGMIAGSPCAAAAGEVGLFTSNSRFSWYRKRTT